MLNIIMLNIDIKYWGFFLRIIKNIFVEFANGRICFLYRSHSAFECRVCFSCVSFGLESVHNSLCVSYWRSQCHIWIYCTSVHISIANPIKCVNLKRTESILILRIRPAGFIKKMHFHVRDLFEDGYLVEGIQ